jgi:hypothetical protein
MFTDDIYETMIDSNEQWYYTGNGGAIFVRTSRLLDC